MGLVPSAEDGLGCASNTCGGGDSGVGGGRVDGGLGADCASIASADGSTLD